MSFKVAEISYFILYVLQSPNFKGVISLKMHMNLSVGSAIYYRAVCSFVLLFLVVDGDKR